jgi:uncharacterized protein (TIGR02118 family)
MVKAIYLIRRKPGMSAEDFHRYWREVHGPIAARIPGLRRYVQCHSIDAGFGDAPEYDGAAEVWFDDMEAVRRAVASPEYAAAREDERRFIDLEHTTLTFTEEVSILA